MPVQRPDWQCATSVLIAINVAVFLLMVLANRAAFMRPPQEMLIKWGADFGPLTLDNQPWRLVTSGFLHIGIIHIAVNMWSLWILGRMAERFVGGVSLSVIYVLTGIGASLASLAWDPFRVSAGASGPIFGFVGLMIGILYFAKDRLDPVARKKLLSWVVRIAVLNLFIGLTAGIDNMAHVGGMVTGAVIGSALVLSTKTRTQNRAAVRRNIFVASFIVLALLFVPLRATRQDAVTAYRAESAMENKDYKAAISILKGLEQAHPNDFSVHAALGSALYFEKQYPESLAEYRKCLELEPNHPEIGINIALVLKDEGKSKEAVDAFAANIEKVKPDAETYKAYGETLIDTNQAKVAEDVLRKAVQLDGNDVDAHLDLAHALTLLGRQSDAANEIKAAGDLQRKQK